MCHAPSFQSLCFSQVKCVIRLVYIFLAMFNIVYTSPCGSIPPCCISLDRVTFALYPRYHDLKEHPVRTPRQQRRCIYTIWVPADVSYQSERTDLYSYLVGIIDILVVVRRIVNYTEIRLITNLSLVGSCGNVKACKSTTHSITSVPSSF